MAFKALDSYIEQYNDAVDNSQTIKASMIHTAQQIIKVYGRSLIKANGVQAIDKENLPSLKTNNKQLATLTKSSSRTIQRHIIRLQEAGIVTEKIFHGSNAGFELLMNKNILLATQKLSVDEAKILLELKLNPIFQTNENQQVTNEGTTKCPHTDNGNNSYNSNNLLIDVDKLSFEHKQATSGYETCNSTGNRKRCSEILRNRLKYDSGNDTGKPLTGNTGEKVSKNLEDAGEKVPKKRAKTDNLDMKARAEAEARGTSLNFYVSMLWMLAKNVLYRDVFLTDRQEEIAQQLLFKWYEPVSTKNLSNVHQIYVERIGLVRKYIEKDPKRRFVQLPYQYFDPHNPNGFAGTKIWHKKHKERQEEVHIKLVLSAQIRRFLNNSKKEPHKQKPSLELFRDCEQRLGKLGDPLLVKEFHAAVLNPDINQAIYIN